MLWEVVEPQQDGSVLGQSRPWLYRISPPRLPGRSRSCLGVLPGFGHPDILQVALGHVLQTLGQFVQDVARLVHPAALLAGLPWAGERLLLHGIEQSERAHEIAEVVGKRVKQ